jgi:hypothetical protein
MERTPNLTQAIAQAALNRDSLRLRELVLELLRSQPDLSLIAPLENASEQERAVLAGILELLAFRRGMVAPGWTVGAINLEPFFLLAAAEVMPRLRELCESESPEPLRKRHLYAPPNFLEFA